MRSVVCSIGLCFGFLLGGCAEPKMPLVDVSVIKAADGATDGMDIYAARRAAGEPVPNLRGNQIVEIRTYLPRINDFGNEVAGQEITGAVCNAILDNHTASVRTPGGIHVPLYGYLTSPFSVECNMDGFQKAIVVAEPYNKTISDRRASAASASAGAGLLGALVATVVIEGINAASDETNDEFRYAVAPVLMRQGAGQSAAAPTVATTPAPSDTVAPRAPSSAESVPSATPDSTGGVAQPPAQTTTQPSRGPLTPSTPGENLAKQRQYESLDCAPWCNQY